LLLLLLLLLLCLIIQFKIYLTKHIQYRTFKSSTHLIHFNGLSLLTLLIVISSLICDQRSSNDQRLII
jgi:hypothetical protein